MTLLQVMPEDQPSTTLLRTRSEEEITTALAKHSVTFHRWPLRGSVTPETASEALLHRYQVEVDQLCADHGLKLVDVARIHHQPGPGAYEREAKARATFLEEHRHSEDEVRFFVHGTGCFYLHLDGQVFAVVCEAGDLLSVPSGTRHWFDMGPQPEFVAIRFFEKEDGWVGDFTGTPIAGRFPRLDSLLSLT